MSKMTRELLLLLAAIREATLTVRLRGPLNPAVVKGLAPDCWGYWISKMTRALLALLLPHTRSDPGR